MAKWWDTRARMLWFTYLGGKKANELIEMGTPAEPKNLTCETARKNMLKSIQLYLRFGSRN